MTTLERNSLSPEAIGLHLALSAVGNSQTELARICGCTPGAIWQMMRKENPGLSVKYVLKVELALHIPRHLLRPDFYPPPETACSMRTAPRSADQSATSASSISVEG